MCARLPGFLVHCFTAGGAALGLAALFAAVDGQFEAMFAWLGAAFVVDAVDGTLARRYRVAETVPHIDGVVLDLVVDFLTYVVVPLVALWRSHLLEPLLAVLVLRRLRSFCALFRRPADEDSRSLVSRLSRDVERSCLLLAGASAATACCHAHCRFGCLPDVRAGRLRSPDAGCTSAPGHDHGDGRLECCGRGGARSGSLGSRFHHQGCAHRGWSLFFGLASIS